MTTRHAANRQNALRSTGPRTEAGRAASSRNALRHGGYSEAVAVLGEDPARFDAMTAEMVHSLRPVGSLEERLVGRLAALWWRLERAGSAEREGLRSAVDAARFARGRSRLLHYDPMERFIPEPAPDFTEPIYTAFSWATAGEGIERLQRYEGQLERSFFRVLHELERVQARRRGQVMAPPVALDVNLTGDAD